MYILTSFMVDYLPLLIANLIAIFLPFLCITEIKKLKWYTAAILFLSWYVIISMTLIIPIDIASSYYNNCVTQSMQYNETNETNCTKSIYYTDANALEGYWYEINILILLLSFLFLPLVSSYINSGAFTFFKRLLYALKDNYIFYLVVGIPAILLIAYVIVKDHISFGNLIHALIAISNTIGLTIYVFYLGYGMVNLTLKKWKCILHKYHLKVLAADVYTEHNKMVDVRDKLNMCIDEINSMSHRLDDRDALTPYMEMIIAKLPFAGTSIRQHDYKNDFIVLSDLEKVHTKLIKLTNKYNQRTLGYNKAVKKASMYYNIVNIKKNNTFVPQATLYEQPINKVAGTNFKHTLLRVDIWRHKFISPVMCLIKAVFFAVFSVTLVWSEIANVMPNRMTDVDIFEKAVALLEQNNSIVWCIVTHLIIILILMTMSKFTFYAIDTYGFQQLYSVKMKIRLMAPICLNFINICKINGTVFSKTIGNYTLIPAIEKFTLYYPLILLVVCIVALFKILDKLIIKFGLSEVLYISEMSDEIVKEGISFVENEIRKENRERFETIMFSDDCL